MTAPDMGQKQAVDFVTGLVDSGSYRLVLKLGDGPSDAHEMSSVVIREPPPPPPAPARAQGPGHHRHPAEITRGGQDASGARAGRAYFTKRPLFRMNCRVSDPSVLDTISGKMLGPQTDFADVRVDIIHGAGRAAARLLANVTNSALLPDGGPPVELGLVVVDVSDVDAQSGSGDDRAA